jgi:hypothetical protein
MWKPIKTRNLIVAPLLLVLASPFLGGSGSQAYKALDIDVGDVLAGTVLSARVIPGAQKQVACVVTYFTKQGNKTDAVNVRLGLFERRGEELSLLYARDFGEEQGALVAGGDLQLLDLDRDGVSEVIVCYDSFEDPLIEQRICEVILQEDAEFRTAWAGPVSYDATKAVRDVPKERRDRFTREFDWAGTIRTRGLTLFMTKKVVTVAGQRLAEPKLVQETFPLRTKPDFR